MRSAKPCSHGQNLMITRASLPSSSNAAAMTSGWATRAVALTLRNLPRSRSATRYCPGSTSAPVLRSSLEANYDLPTRLKEGSGCSGPYGAGVPR